MGSRAPDRVETCCQTSTPTSMFLPLSFIVVLATSSAAGTPGPPATRPTIHTSFVGKMWTLQNSSDSLFVNQTVRVAVSEVLGAVAQNQSLKDGRSASSKAFYSPQTPAAAAGVYALDPFFDRIACYLYPPTLQGDPSHMTLDWAMALQLLYAGVALGAYNGSSYHGMATIGGRECELWYTGFNSSDDARFCVERSTGMLLSANRTAFQGDIHEISMSVLTDVAPVDTGASYFAVPNKTGCVDLRALPAALSVAFPLAGAAREGTTAVDDPTHLAWINRAIAASGGSWTTSTATVTTTATTTGEPGMTLAAARDRVRRGGVLTSNPWSAQYIGGHDSDRTSQTVVATVAITPAVFSGALPVAFDARTAWPHCDSIGTPREQGRCGSCWAFSSAEALSDRFCVQTGANETLSVEYLMDCNTANNGCGGGLLDDSWKFMATTGLPTDSCVPYQEEAGPLPTGPIPCGAVQRCLPGGGDKNFVLHAAKGGAYPVGNFTSDVDGMQRDLMANGPISVAFQVFSDFHSYRAGVYTRTAAGQLDGGHAVKIVGWGVDPEGGPYWTVANSWGPTWGMQGFFNIKRGVNECGIEQTPAAGMIRG